MRSDVTSTGTPSPLRPGRAERQGRRRKRRTLTSLAVLGALVGVLVLAAVVSGGDEQPSAGGGASDPSGTVLNSTMMVFQVRGTTAPMMAIVGARTDEHAAGIVPIPQDLTIIAPGQGEATATEVAALPGPSVQIALSNLAGSWLPTYAVLTLGGVADVVDRAGGLRLTLTETYPTKLGPLGPGTVTLSGAQVKAFLAGTTDDAGTRWELVSLAWLANPPNIDAADVAEGDAEGASAILSGARDAQVIEIPTKSVSGTIQVPDYGAFDAVMAQSFGLSTPTPAIVQNGSGVPGVGEAVGARIIPEGFRITLSQNAQSFDIAATDVFANGEDNEDDARRARRALGVGHVRVSQVTSGIGDITIVVGKDFTLDAGGTG